MSTSVSIEVSNPTPGLRVIEFNNPTRKNAINRPSYIRLYQAMEEASADDSVSVIAVTGVGEYFSSGNDIGNLAGSDNIETMLDESIVIVRRLVHSFVRCPKLLVAVVNGPAIGIAATLAALCDVVYASETAYFYTPFTILGLSAEGCSSYTFPRILGPSKAAEMLLLNHRMDAREAHRFRFVADVFSTDELRTKLWPRIHRLADPSVAHQSVRATKMLMRHQQEQELLGACEQEMTVLRARMQSEEAFTAVMQFTEANRKRKREAAAKAKL